MKDKFVYSIVFFLGITFYLTSETDSFIGPRIAVFYITLGLIVIVESILSVYYWKTQDKELSISLSDPLFLGVVGLFFIYILFSCLWTSCKPCTLNTLKFLFSLPLFIYLMKDKVLKEKRKIYKFLDGIYILSVIIAIYSLFQYYGIDFLNLSDRAGKFRISGIYANPNFYANFLIIPFFIGCSKLIDLFDKSMNSRKEKLKTIILLVSFLFLTTAIVFARSKSVWIAICAGLLYFFLTLRIKHHIVLFVSFFLIVILLFLPYLYLLITLFGSHGNAITEKGLNIPFSFLKSLDFLNRVSFFYQGMLMLSDSHFLGIGPGSIFKLAPVYKAKFFLSNPLYKKFFTREGIYLHLHNEYVEILAEYGIIGFLLLFIIFSYIIYMVTKGIVNSKSFKDKILSGTLLSSVLAFSIDCLSSFPLHLPANLLLFVTILTILFILNKEEMSTISKTFKLRMNITLSSFLLICFLFVGIFYLNNGIRYYFFNTYYSYGRWIMRTALEKSEKKDFSTLLLVRANFDKALKFRLFYPRRDIYPEILKVYMLTEKKPEKVETLLQKISSFTYSPDVLRAGAIFYFSQKEYKMAIPYIENYLKETFMAPSSYFDRWVTRLKICYDKLKIPYSDFLKSILTSGN